MNGATLAGEEVSMITGCRIPPGTVLGDRRDSELSYLGTYY